MFQLKSRLRLWRISQFPLLHISIDEKQNRSNYTSHRPNNRQRKRPPKEIIIMPWQPIIPVRSGPKNNDCNHPTNTTKHQNRRIRSDAGDEVFLIGPQTEEIDQTDDGADQNTDQTEGEEELGGDYEPGHEVASDLVVAGCEGIIDPSAANEETALVDVYGVW